MKKRLLTIALALCMVVSLLPFSGAAAEIFDSDSWGENLTWTLYTDGTLVISGTGELAEYRSMSYWYKSEKIHSIVVESGVTSIADDAFDDYTCVSSISIPSTVTQIGNNAFPHSDIYDDDDDVSSLESIQVDKDNPAYSSVDGVLFDKNQTKLLLYPAKKHGDSYAIPGSVAEIGSGAFANCSSLTNLTIPDSVTTIGSGAFSKCSNIAELSIPGGVKSIEDGTFYWCSSLKSVTIPDSVTSIGERAFSGCTALTNVTIPDSVTSIGYGAFSGCKSLTSIVIPDSVMCIEDYTFSGCSALTSVTISDSVMSIGNGAFFCCESLTSIVIPDSVMCIEDSTFSDCSALTSVTIPDSVSKIGSNAFSSCESLTSIVIPNSVTSIGDRAFSYCTSLKRIALPDSVTYIDNLAFFKCESLETAELPNRVNQLGGALFCGCTSLKEVRLPKNVYSLDDYDNIYDGMTPLDGGFFASCSSLQSITLPDNIRSLDNACFYGCTSLREVIGAENATVYSKAFMNCSSLKEIAVGSVSGDNAFQGCTALEAITIHGNLYGENCFADCSALERVTLTHATELGAYALGNCKSLKSVWLPCSLKTVAANAFRGCDALAQVQYCGTESMWNAISIRETGNAALLNASLQFVNHRPEMLWAFEGEEPTCFKDGNAPYWRCYNCDKLYSDAEGTNEIAEPEVLPSPGHVWTPWKLTEPATEYSGGRMDRVCTVCGQKDWRWVPPYQPSPFVDVIAGKYYYNAVLWAVNHEPQVTNGTDATHFAPNAPCKRGEVVTFLWRAMGCPEPTKTDCPFTDVSPKKFYYKAVLWAVENGITTGTSATTFGPNEPCTRGHVVTFLYRAKKAQPVAIDHPFTDLNPKGFYYKAVLWAVANDITQGTSKTTFEPGKTCTRGQIVTFLQRAEMV